MRPVHACTFMRPRTLGLCLHVHASCACTVCVHGFFRCVHHVSTMYGVACTGCPVWMCVSTGGVRRARFYLRMCVHRSGCIYIIPHTYIHTYIYIERTRGVYFTSCVVCVHTCTGGVTCTVFFRVCTAHVLSHVYVHAWAPKSHRGSARVGMHDRPREGGACTHLPRKSCTRRRMCAFATACTRDEGTKKTEDATEIERVPLEGWVEVRNLYRRPR
jgi:hypothetical protein